MDDSILKDAYATIGELVLTAAALDEILNKVVIESCHLEQSPFLDPVIATIDISRKIEIIKNRSKHIKDKTWSNSLKKFSESAEKVNSARNDACHGSLRFVNEKPVLVGTSISKILKAIVGDKKFEMRYFKDAIQAGEKALQDGANLVENLKRVNEARSGKRKS